MPPTTSGTDPASRPTGELVERSRNDLRDLVRHLHVTPWTVAAGAVAIVAVEVLVLWTSHLFDDISKQGTFGWWWVLVAIAVIPLSLVVAGLVLDLLGQTVNTMIVLGLAAALGVLVGTAGRAEAQTAELKVGDAAPAFSLPGSDGKTHSLAESKGKRAVVLAWFPKAFTGG